MIEAGYYLKPYAIVHQDYKKYYPDVTKMWENFRNDLGKVMLTIPHKSTFSRKFDNIQKNQIIESDIKITGDGLIFTEIPEVSEYIDDTLDALQLHLNSFLGTVNLGGYFFEPIKENYISPISESSGQIMFSSQSWDGLFSTPDPDRIQDRYSMLIEQGTNRKIFRSETINFLHPTSFEGHYKNGLSIANELKISSDVLLLGLYAVNYFSHRNWNAALLIGWSFIESIIECIWKKLILEKASGGQKTRLKDNRTYSASVKLELLFRQEIIAEEQYEYLNLLRGYRNELIHSGKGVYKPMIDGMFPHTNKLILVLSENDPGINRQGGIKPGGWIPNKKFRDGHPIWTGKQKKE